MPSTMQVNTDATSRATQIARIVQNRKAHAEAVNNCEKELKTLLSEPSQAGFAIVEEFVDRVLRAKDIRSEWQIFLHEIAADVWTEEVGSTLERTQLRRDWMHQIGEVEQATQPDTLNFLR